LGIRQANFKTLKITVTLRRRPKYTFEQKYCEFGVNPFLCLQPVIHFQS